MGILKNNGKAGTNDSPSAEDFFGIKPYTDGLSNFIASCCCPMTLAIQGDWGTGKTSMMKRIMENETIKKDCVTVELNTWEYSQFELGNSLPVVFYTALIEKMGGGDKIDDEVKKNVANAIKGIMIFGLSIAEKSGVGQILSTLFGAVKAGTEKVEYSKEEKSLIKAIDELKDNFKKVLEARLKAEKKNRMIIFIDDLDRIEPKRAVELMEILKIMLEVDKSVFVLAIDYDVVVRGIKAKYGADMDEKKARSFFDKIIQVPFSLPVGNYDINQYVGRILTEMNAGKQVNGLLKKNDNNEVEVEYVARDKVIELISSSVGRNPRAIKRLLNSFSLLSIIRDAQNLENENKKEKKDDREDIILFATLCLQLSYGRIYDYLLAVRNEADKVNKLVNFMVDINPKEIGKGDFYGDFNDAWAKGILKLESYSEVELSQLRTFFETFQSAFLEGEEEIGPDNNDLKEEQFKLLKKAMQFSSSTSVKKDSMGTSSELPAKIDYVCKVVKECLEDNTANLNEVAKRVAKDVGVGYTTVSDQYTRNLGIKTNDFERLLKNYIHNGNREIVEKIKSKNKEKYHELIDKEFERLDKLRKGE